MPALSRNGGSGAEASVQRGRPRSEQAREAILAAAGELLLGHGLGDVSMDAVARRAGVSKATIYRWWPTKHELALDTLYHEWAAAHPASPDTGALRSDLIAYLRPWVRRARARSFARVIGELIAEVHKTQAFAERYYTDFVEPRRVPVRAFFQNAVNRGEIPATDIDLALDLLFGPLYHRLLHLHAPVTDGYLENVVDAVIRAVTSDHPPSGAGRRGS